MIEIISMRDATPEEIREYSRKDQAKHEVTKRRMNPIDRTRTQVYATGNRWAIENFEATH